MIKVEFIMRFLCFLIIIFISKNLYHKRQNHAYMSYHIWNSAKKDCTEIHLWHFSTTFYKTYSSSNYKGYYIYYFYEAIYYHHYREIIYSCTTMTTQKAFLYLYHLRWFQITSCLGYQRRNGRYNSIRKYKILLSTKSLVARSDCQRRLVLPQSYNVSTYSRGYSSSQTSKLHKELVLPGQLR